MEQNGSKLLKVMSILMIIGGIFGAIGSVVMALFASLLSAASSDPGAQEVAAEAGTNMGALTALIWVGVVILVIGAVIEIIAGVRGVKNWNNPAAATSLMILGIICAIFSLVGNILFASGNGISILSILSGLVIPVLYIIGALQLKNKA